MKRKSRKKRRNNNFLIIVALLLTIAIVLVLFEIIQKMNGNTRLRLSALLRLLQQSLIHIGAYPEATPTNAGTDSNPGTYTNSGSEPTQ